MYWFLTNDPINTHKVERDTDKIFEEHKSIILLSNLFLLQVVSERLFYGTT